MDSPGQSPQSVTSGISYTADELEELKKSTVRQQPPPEEVQAQSPDDILAEVQRQLSEGKTPDRALVDAARKRREQLREKPPAKSKEADFISLTEADSDTEFHRRQDEEERLLDAGDDRNDMMDVIEDELIIGKSAIRDSERQAHLDRQKAFDDAENEVLEESDEEIRRWELEQIRSGGAPESRDMFKHDEESLILKIHNAIKISPIPTVADAHHAQSVQHKAQAEFRRLQDRFNHYKGLLDARLNSAAVVSGEQL
ncbi:hypothetical protein BJ085DRAFT_30669 [Dimargaris cristalligena]|uniref:Nineteen complex-related protein 2-domain-containing protein n=1 Tax=Dimargaris cristalligena TaxID=215637 RepID=A0A4Q0A0S8_9FUNG|nr:hypothetical protein BJ085DRAFT_30669 [Dimargaris cristalligena]|eukprot:RKP39617.1 hypothetical protein BJ085DRAFT_30669 [Dimargaris cristalligena]